MKYFKSIIQVVILAVITFNFTSCDSESTSGPENVVADFYTKLAQLDFESAKELCTDDTKQLIGVLEGMVAMMPEDKKAEGLAELTNESVSASDYTCTIDGNVALCVENETKEEINLVFVDDQWLIDIPKEDFDKE